MRFGRRVVVCQEWTELVTDYLEGALPSRLVRSVERHLAGCPHCLEYLAQMRRTIELTGHLGDEDFAAAPGEMVDLLVRAFEEFHRSDR